MPPKKKATEPTKKTVEKQKQKIIEDKTFGLKNKKGAKQQKFIKTVTTQVQHGNKTAKQMEKDKQEKLSKKDQKKKELEELNALLKPVQTLGKGVDPKSVLCAFFKQGTCTKGDKCKFSHDLNISRKGEKRSIYSDVRNEEETMEDWDEAKLEEVVSKKHGESNNAKPTTSIICKYFLEAVENSKYGWFWQCPNGDSCKYRHALPPGFVLKKDKKKEEKDEEISMEELVERERAALGDNLTKVTLETFLQWKERKRKEKIQAAKAASEKKKSDFKQGKMLGISGREMFTYNPDLVAGDDEEADDIVYTREPDEEENGDVGQGQVREINLEALAAEAQEADDKNTTVAPSDRWKQEQNGQALQNGPTDDDESTKQGMAAALPDPSKDTDAAIAAALSATVGGDALAGDTPIDENLFDGEDLDLVEDELETLELED